MAIIRGRQYSGIRLCRNSTMIKVFPLNSDEWKESIVLKEIVVFFGMFGE